MRLGIGCSIEEFVQSPEYQSLTVINIENPLYPGYLDTYSKIDIERMNRFRNKKFIVDGAYIDLNPGTPEPIIRQITKKKVMESILFAEEIGAQEIIFLSTFLPMIKVEFYEKGWLETSKEFWKEIISEGINIRISLCNTFEYTPKYLLQIVKEVNDKNFGMAFDIGHAVLWGKISLEQWYEEIKDYLSTIYIHSNDGEGDLHFSIWEGKLQEPDLGFNTFIDRIKGNDYNLILKYFNKENILKDLFRLEKRIIKMD